MAKYTLLIKHNAKPFKIYWPTSDVSDRLAINDTKYDPPPARDHTNYFTRDDTGNYLTKLDRQLFVTVRSTETHNYLSGFATFVIPLLKCISEPASFYAGQQPENSKRFIDLFKAEVAKNNALEQDLPKVFKSYFGRPQELCYLYGLALKNAYVQYLTEKHIIDEKYTASDDDMQDIAKILALRSFVIIEEHDTSWKIFKDKITIPDDSHGKIDFAVIKANGTRWSAMPFFCADEEINYALNNKNPNIKEVKVPHPNIENVASNKTPSMGEQTKQRSFFGRWIDNIVWFFIEFMPAFLARRFSKSAKPEQGADNKHPMLKKKSPETAYKPQVVQSSSGVANVADADFEKMLQVENSTLWVINKKKIDGFTANDFKNFPKDILEWLQKDSWNTVFLKNRSITLDDLKRLSNLSPKTRETVYALWCQFPYSALIDTGQKVMFSWVIDFVQNEAQNDNKKLEDLHLRIKGLTNLSMFPDILKVENFDFARFMTLSKNLIGLFSDDWIARSIISNKYNRDVNGDFNDHKRSVIYRHIYDMQKMPAEILDDLDALQVVFRLLFDKVIETDSLATLTKDALRQRADLTPVEIIKLKEDSNKNTSRHDI